MYALPTTTVSVLRGQSTDQFGDVYDNDTIAASGIPCSLIEQTRNMLTADSPTPRVVHYTVGRIGADTDILETDRVLDEVTGVKYIVQGIARIGNPVMKADLRLDLKRTT